MEDRVTVGRLLNNIGGLTHMLGRPEEAVGYLQDSLAIWMSGRTAERRARSGSG